MTNGVKKSFDIKTHTSGRILEGHSNLKSLLENSDMPDLHIAGPLEVGKVSTCEAYLNHACSEL